MTHPRTMQISSITHFSNRNAPNHTPLPPRRETDLCFPGEQRGPFIMVESFDNGIEPKYLVFKVAEVKKFKALAEQYFSPTTFTDEDAFIAYLQNPTNEVIDFINYLRNKAILNNNDILIPTLYLLKQYYIEGEKVAPSLRRILGTNFINRLPNFLKQPVARIFWFFRHRHTNTENLNALNEVVATAIARGYAPAQQQQIEFSNYSDGRPMMVTVAKFKSGLQTLQGKLQGDRNQKVIVDPHNANRSDPRFEGMGRFALLSIARNDVDDFGSEGQNFGFIDKGRTITHYGFDFGQTCRGKNELVAAIEDNFLFKKNTTKIKNLSCLLDAKPSELIKGAYLIYAGMSEKDKATVFSNKTRLKIESAIAKHKKQDPSFANQYERVPSNLVETRFEEMLELCSEQAEQEEPLAQQEYKSHIRMLRKNKKNVQKANRELLQKFKAPMTYSPQELDLIHHLEMLNRDITTHNSNQKIKLKHLQIVPRNKNKVNHERIKLKIKHEPSGTVKLIGYWHNVNQGDIENLISVIRFYTARFNYQIRNKKLEIALSKSDFLHLIKNFNEEALIQFKQTRELPGPKAETTRTATYAQLGQPLLKIDPLA